MFIVEVGARDCQETLRFHALYPASAIYAFECNPQTLPLCRQAVAGIAAIQLVEKAVANTSGTTTFYAIDPDQTVTTWADGNPGASSLLPASGKYPVERYVQRAIEVETITLSDFLPNIASQTIDLLWMDIQGAELMALEGLGGAIQKVGLIHLEVGFFEIYTQQPKFADIKRYLNQRGFLFVAFTAYGRYTGDAVFVNRKLLTGRLQLLWQVMLDQLLPAGYFLTLGLAASLRSLLKKAIPARG